MTSFNTPHKTVLIVDDSRVSRLLVQQYFLSANAGWAVEQACNGEDAIARAATLAPALILLDVNMAGMGGVAAAAQLRQLCPASHISLLTANVQHATRNRAADMGIGFMAKPVTETRIHQLIAALDG